jgi:hypothetical protein
MRVSLVFNEVLGRWLQLPHDLPHDNGLDCMTWAARFYRRSMPLACVCTLMSCTR